MANYTWQDYCMKVCNVCLDFLLNEVGDLCSLSLMISFCIKIKNNSKFCLIFRELRTSRSTDRDYELLILILAQEFLTIFVEVT